MNDETCEICGQPLIKEHKPFCSKRCKNVDLQRWLGGNYRIQCDEEPDPGEPIPFNSEIT